MKVRAPQAWDEPVVVGRYTLYAPIASGGMATVHLGRANDTFGPAGVVAIKRLHPHLASDPDFMTMFLDEAKLTMELRHDNVVPTNEAFAVGTEAFIVMPYVEGETLSRLLRSYAPPSFDVVARVVAEALRGLHAAHIATGKDGRPLNIVHRDVSPQNIIVDTKGVSRVLDFGIAKAAGRMHHTRTGEVKGKLGYMAPEQLLGEEVSSRSDVFSMGVVLWELITGKRLFKGDNEGAIMMRILEGKIPSAKEVFAAQVSQTISISASGELIALDRIARRALERSPAARYGTAEEMATDLTASLDLASPADIGAWVSAAARDLLASRSALLEQLPSGVYDLGVAAQEPIAATEGDDVLFPIIVADLADPAARDVLVRVAERGGTALVPLLTAPADRSVHVLEIHTPGEAQATFLRASAMGPPEAAGFPLRLGLLTSRVVNAETAPSAEPPTVQAASRTFTRNPLSPEHARDLTSTSAEQLVEANVVGRKLADGKLAIEARIGGGSGGSVYRARLRHLKRPVAVKVLHDSARMDAEFCARFHAEALAASSLDHKNLVRVLDFGQEPDGLLYITMEYLDGISLRGILERDGRLSPSRAMDVMIQVCAGLAHAHASGVIHRDIKPSNVVLVEGKDDDGRPVQIAKVCDFGIALQPASEGAAKAAEVAGTPAYMSPEQCSGADLDGRSDVYSCGVMLYELVTGLLPFSGHSAAEFVRLNMTAVPPPPSTHLSTLDPRLERIILKALSKQPENRQRGVRELRGELKEILLTATSPGHAIDASIPPPPAGEGVPAAIGSTNDLSPVATSAPREAELLANELVASPAEWLDGFARARNDEAVIAAQCSRLQRAVPQLAERGEAQVLGLVVRFLTAIHEEARGGTTGTDVLRVLHAIADAATLGPLAANVLHDANEPSPHAISLLRWAQVSGALSLHHARTQNDSALARGRFVSLMRQLGGASAPAVRAALHQLRPSSDAPLTDVPLAMDLLACVASAHDEAMGTIVARYVRVHEAGVARAALIALVEVWGERANPLLLASLGAESDEVRVAALRGLGALGQIDAFVVRKIQYAAADEGASEALLRAYEEALLRSTSEAQPSVPPALEVVRSRLSAVSAVRGPRSP